MAATLNQDVKKGYTYKRDVTFKNKASGLPKDLTGHTITGELKKGTTTIPLVITMLDADAGRFRVGLTAETTGGMQLTKYDMVVRILYPDGALEPLYEGQFVVYA